MGLFLGVALSMHYQSLNLLIFFPAILLIKGINIKTKISFFFINGYRVYDSFFPTPLLGCQQNFANIRNIMDYFLIAQYRIYVPNSWRIYLIKIFSQLLVICNRKILFCRDFNWRLSR